jgi:hypothetical protein
MSRILLASVFAASLVLAAVACGGSSEGTINPNQNPGNGSTSSSSSSGANGEVPTRTPTKVGEPNAPANVAIGFHLFVSNQSFDLDPVDIDLYIDGTHIITGDFEVKGQHNWLRFDFKVATGEHELRAVSKKGGAERKASFKVNGTERWGVVNYWFSKASQPKDLSMDFYDKEPAFQ